MADDRSSEEKKVETIIDSDFPSLKRKPFLLFGRNIGNLSYIENWPLVEYDYVTKYRHSNFVPNKNLLKGSLCYKSVLLVQIAASVCSIPRNILDTIRRPSYRRSPHCTAGSGPA